MTILRLAVFLAVAFSLPAQTLQNAESLWKSRRYKEANDAFRALTQKEPQNATYRVRWGRLLLERGNAGDAEDLFKEAIEIKKDSADAYTGLALTASDRFEGAAAELARKALECNPKQVEAQALLARIALEDNDNKKAEEEARKALALDSGAAQAKAILATLDWLADKKESEWDPKDARGYETVADLFVLNRRYDEGIAFYRKALALDPFLDSARSNLGISLMRMGRDSEARVELDNAFENGYANNPTKNSLRLLDTLEKFETSRQGKVVLRMDRKESALLKPYFQSEAQRAIAAFEKKYEYKLDRPVQIEAYPNHEDFAVRTLGMPGLGALGVTFGHSIAMDSPSARPPGGFHWASTLWHEMSHVFTLAMTGSHVPRWFTEGIAVHEETVVSPEWGDRIAPEVILAIKEKKLLPITELDRGFIHPKNPAQVGVSYFQGGRICDYITDKYGWNTILAMLREFAGGADTATVVRNQLKLEPAEFDKQFLAWLEADIRKAVDGFDDWRKQMKQLAEASKAKDYDAVIKLGTAIRDVYPDYVETGSVYELLATAHLGKENKAAATAELQRYVKIGGRDPALLKQLSGLLSAAGDKKEAAAVLERLNFIYPMDPEQHYSLGGLWLGLGNASGAIREYSAVLARNPIDPAGAHYQLARAYQMNKQPDEARDAVLASLEVAPGYRPAQKLLLELSAAESIPVRR